MALDLTYPSLLSLFPEHLDPKRSESAAFLIWYLENYSRLDPVEAVDFVCDQRGDKGVDGIYVNDNDQTITVFQARISQKTDSTIGDTALKEFAGTLAQFKDAESIKALMASAGKAHIASLIERLDLVNKISTHELRGEFLSNLDQDANGDAYLKQVPHISFIGKSRLIATYISDTRALPVHAPVSFDIADVRIAEYVVDADTRTMVAPIKATELVALNGIANQSLFTYNLRGPLGGTAINREIVKSIREPSRHKLFPLFHNGITIIARTLKANANALIISDYFVVNGCQSLTALYENGKHLTDNLRVLTKFIQMDPTSPESEMVTHFSNNQNGVKARDFMANNRMQIRLQKEFNQNYRSQYAFDIKRGEPFDKDATVISNEAAGLYLMAFDLKEPWATHRRYQVFEDKHADLFGRPEVTADRIVFCQAIMEVIADALPKIHNGLFARYVLTQYFLLYVIRLILENDSLARRILTSPEVFVRQPTDRERFRHCIKTFVDDLIIDVNGEVDGYGEDFDYRNRLRDADWVKKLAGTVVADHLKRVSRGRIKSFKDEWESTH